VRIGNGTPGQIIINGKTQEHAYSEEDRGKVNLITSMVNDIQQNTTDISNTWNHATAPKILLRITPLDNWSIFGRTTQFDNGQTYASKNNNHFYLFPLNTQPEFVDYINPYTNEWNAGAKRIRVKYNMSFKSYGSLITDFYSQIKVYDPGNNLTYSSFKSGVERDQGVNYMKWLHYNDDLTFDIENGHKIFLYTQYDMSMEFGRSFESNTTFEITEL
jgi:hypothetical protein